MYRNLYEETCNNKMKNHFYDISDNLYLQECSDNFFHNNKISSSSIYKSPSHSFDNELISLSKIKFDDFDYNYLNELHKSVSKTKERKRSNYSDFSEDQKKLKNCNLVKPRVILTNSEKSYEQKCGEHSKRGEEMNGEYEKGDIYKKNDIYKNSDMCEDNNVHQKNDIYEDNNIHQKNDINERDDSHKKGDIYERNGFHEKNAVLKRNILNKNNNTGNLHNKNVGNSQKGKNRSLDYHRRSNIQNFYEYKMNNNVDDNILNKLLTIKYENKIRNDSLSIKEDNIHNTKEGSVHEEMCEEEEDFEEKYSEDIDIEDENISVKLNHNDSEYNKNNCKGVKLIQNKSDFNNENMDELNVSPTHTEIDKEEKQNVLLISTKEKSRIIKVNEKVDISPIKQIIQEEKNEPNDNINMDINDDEDNEGKSKLKTSISSSENGIPKINILKNNENYIPLDIALNFVMDNEKLKKNLQKEEKKDKGKKKTFVQWLMDERKRRLKNNLPIDI
ncbi:ring-infested erythrocyte surface antigen [Plasmodium falciparum RAJ116]|uniref:Ring-infested erythrocyte surface antigen n=2 Tax=Plasmodium falciparum TaxID=5833 RepID=A0A0L0CZL4_PLAFA|nr:ring-infested erythrocyte surface antigen [Plasmodium falciparum RAJ116]